MLNAPINALYSLVSNSAQGLYYYSVTSPHTQKLINAIRQKDMVTLRAELQNGPDYQAIGFERSLLHEAVQCQNIDAVTEILSHHIETNEICEGLTPLGRAIQLGNQPIAEILIKRHAELTGVQIQNLPRVLQVAVKDKKLAPRDAEKLAFRLQHGCCSFDNVASYLEPINKLLTFEGNIHEGYQQHFQQAKDAVSYLEGRERYAYHPTIRYEVGTVNVRAPQLIIRYASKYNIPKLEHDLARAALNSPEWHQLRSMIDDQKRLAREQEVLPIEDFAKMCKQTFADNKVNVEIKIEPQYEKFYGTQVQLLYPNFEIAQADKLKALQTGLAPFMSQGAPLVEVLRNNQPQQVIACLRDELTEQTEPALHLACRLKSRDMVRMLLNSKANVNQLYKGFSALQLALAQNDEELAILLVENGANPDVSVEGKSALSIAAIRNWPRLAQALILKRANPSVDCQGELAFDAAVRLQNIDVLQVFHRLESMLGSNRFQGYSKRNGRYPSTSAFSWFQAIAQNDEPFMQVLEQLKIDCNQVDKRLGTPLHQAIQLGDHRLIERLLSLGANPTIKFQDRNAFEYAIHLGSLATTRPNRYSKIVEMMILQGIPEKLRLNSLRLINYCIQQQLWDGVRHLTAKRMPASHEWCTFSHYTHPPLLTAINQQAAPIIRDLLTTDELKMTSAWCMRNKVVPPLNKAVQQYDMNLIRTLMYYAGNDLASIIDKPLLHDAVRRDGFRHANPRIIRYLIENGCDINEMHQDLTVLQVAISYCEEDIVKELLTYSKLEINRQNTQGNTALHTALRSYNIINHIDLIRDLITAGADLFIVNQQGDCPFDIIMINPELRRKMMEIYGEDFININLARRNCLDAFLSDPKVRTQLFNDPAIGEGGFLWLREQSTKGTQAAEACLARLMVHNETLSEFMKNHFGDAYHQYLLENQAKLIAHCDLLAKPEPVPVPEPAPVLLNHYKRQRNAYREDEKKERYKPY